jgi:hypothetical protein
MKESRAAERDIVNVTQWAVRFLFFKQGAF